MVIQNNSVCRCVCVRVCMHVLYNWILVGKKMNSQLGDTEGQYRAVEMSRRRISRSEGQYS